MGQLSAFGTICELISLVGCATQGTVTVSVTARGPGTDTLSATVEIDADRIAGKVALQGGRLDVPGVTIGGHLVRLAGLPINCQAEHGVAQSVVVSTRQTARAVYIITCS